MTPEDEPEDDRPLRLDLVGRQRPAPGPGHQQVDVAIEVAVDRVGAARGERPAEHRPEDERAPAGPVDAARAGARQVARREDHRRDRRDEQQLDDPRLGQRDVGADRVAGRPGAARSRPASVAGDPACRRSSTRARVVAGDRQPGQRRPDRPPRARGGASASTRPSRVRTCAPPITTWIANSDGRADRQPDERRAVALGPPGDDGDGQRRSARRPRRPSDAGRGRRSRRSPAGPASRPSAASPGRPARSRSR